MNNPKLDIDETKLNEFMGKALGDMGAGISTALILIGDRLGLYKAMAGAGPMTSQQLADKTRYAKRCVGNGFVGKPRPDTSLLIPRHRNSICLMNRPWLWLLKTARR